MNHEDKIRIFEEIKNYAKPEENYSYSEIDEFARLNKPEWYEALHHSRDLKRKVAKYLRGEGIQSKVLSKTSASSLGAYNKRKKKRFAFTEKEKDYSSFERKYLEFRNKKKPKYMQVFYDKDNNLYYIHEREYSKYEQLIESGQFKVRDRRPLTDKELYGKHGSIVSLMQSSIPGRGQNKKHPHNTDGMHI